MGYEVQSAAGAGAGAVGSWFEGIQKGEDRKRKQRADDADRALAATQAATQADYYKGVLSERTERDDLTRKKNEADAENKQGKLDLADRVAKDAAKNRLANHADAEAERLRKTAALFYTQGQMNMRAQAAITARHDDVMRRIRSGELISADRISAILSMGNLRANTSLQVADKNVAGRVTTTGMTVTGAGARNDATIQSRISIENAKAANQAARTAQTNSVRAKTELKTTPVERVGMQLTPLQQGEAYNAKKAMDGGAPLSAIQGGIFARVRQGHLTMADATAVLNYLQSTPVAPKAGGGSAAPPFPGP